MLIILVSNSKYGMVKINAPLQAPISKAGDKTPPNIPKLRHKEVRRIFKININIKNKIKLLLVITSTTVSDPSPTTSGRKVANIPQINPEL